MLVLDAFKGHLTPEIKSVIHAMNTSQLQVLEVVVNNLSRII
jgi:hypothetical protein